MNQYGHAISYYYWTNTTKQLCDEGGSKTVWFTRRDPRIRDVGSHPEAKPPRQIMKLDSGSFVKDIVQMQSEAVTGMFTRRLYSCLQWAVNWARDVFTGRSGRQHPLFVTPGTAPVMV